MKYKSTLPLSAIGFYIFIFILVSLNIIPHPEVLTQDLEKYYLDFSFLFVFIVILIESIVYLGFYFPGQLLAVLIVTSSDSSFTNIILLTLVSIVAVTFSAFINYYLGYYGIGKLSKEKKPKFSYKGLLLSMIHINFLALYVYNKGVEKQSKKIILLVGFLNLPYYFLIMSTVLFFKSEIKLVAENSYFLISLLVVWALYALYQDAKKYYDKRTTK